MEEKIDKQEEHEEEVEIGYDEAFDEAVGEEPVTTEEVEPNQEEVTPQPEEATPAEGEEQPVEGEEPEDVWLNVPDRVKAEYQNLKNEFDLLDHKFKSNEGRWAAAQRVLTEKSQGKEPAKPAPPKQVIQDALEDSAKWEPFERDYPEIAEMFREQAGRWKQQVDSLQAQQQQQMEAIQPKLQNLEQAEHLRRAEAERAELTRLHSDWQEVWASPEFQLWRGKQPPSTEQALTSYSAVENAAVLSRFKMEKRVAELEQEHQTLINQTEQQAQRTKTLELSRSLPPSKSAASPTGNPNTYEDTWNAITK